MCAYVYTRDALILMSPIYFHGNYKRYRDHNNTIEESSDKNTIFPTLLPALATHICQ